MAHKCTKVRYLGIFEVVLRDKVHNIISNGCVMLLVSSMDENTQNHLLVNCHSHLPLIWWAGNLSQPSRYVHYTPLIQIAVTNDIMINIILIII